MKYKNLYNELIKVEAIEKQEGYFYEEIGELLQALNHYKRGRCLIEDVYNELVDVQITLDILKNVFELTTGKEKNITDIKINKIKNYIKKCNHETI